MSSQEEKLNVKGDKPILQISQWYLQQRTQFLKLCQTAETVYTSTINSVIFVSLVAYVPTLTTENEVKSFDNYLDSLRTFIIHVNAVKLTILQLRDTQVNQQYIIVVWESFMCTLNNGNST